MTDPGNEHSRSRFGWIRDLFRPGRRRPPINRLHRDLEQRTLETQVDIIRRAFDEQVRVAVGRGDDASTILYHPGRVLTDRDGVDRLRLFFEAHQDEETGYRGAGDTDTEPIEGLFTYLLPPRHRDGEVDVFGTLAEIDRELGEGVATPDHILYVVAKPGKLCPATEPLLPSGTDPVPRRNPNSDAGKDIRVSVVDTGWCPDAAKDADSPWLEQGVGGDVEPIGKNQKLGSYAGHGTFVAGVIRCLAPGTTIEIEGVLRNGGAVYESDIARELVEAMKDEPQLISISAGTHTRNGLPLLSFVVLAHLYQLIDGEDAPLVVAAAGNDGKDAPFWPAAFDWVVGVGALDLEGNVTDFSNHGDWVDVYAHGDQLVNAFPTGDYEYVEATSGPLLGTTQHFTGLAQWSGTSFATPIVTGAIAAYMSDNDVKARRARDELIDRAPKPASARLGQPITQLGPPFM